MDKDATTRAPSARTLATRARIIATAEELFAARGVDSVSLNEITRAAGQKNRNAVHYHFGSKDALLHAIFEKHQAPVGERRGALLAGLSDEPGLREVVAALVRPVAERLDDSDGGVAYVRISSQLAASNMLDFFHTGATRGNPHSSWARLDTLLRSHLATLPRALLEQRLSLAVGIMFHGLADHALYREQAEPGLGHAALTVGNLIDSIDAMLSAPISDETRRALDQL